MEKLLFVDDEANLATLYEQEFADEGYDVTVASNGPEALELLKTYRPDLAVLDIAMPGMDGIELLEKILNIDKTIPVIFNTAYSNHKDNFMTWSADAYVVKSGDLRELKEKIRELLDARSLPVLQKEASCKYPLELIG